MKPHAGWALLLLMGSWHFTLVIACMGIYVSSAASWNSEIRATCVGLAAASAKIGGLLGVVLFPLADHAYGLGAVLMAGAVASLLGVVVTASLMPRQLPDLRELEGLPLKPPRGYTESTETTRIP